MSTDRRCGTCRHYRPESDGMGKCGVPPWQHHLSVIDSHVCLKWEPQQVSDYARGWRDALAAAKQECDDMARHLQRNLTDDTPSEIADPLVDQACVAINLGHAIAALEPQ